MGQTAFKRQRGKDYVGETACFGEAICCRIPLRIQTKMVPRWEADGVFLGKLDLSDVKASVFCNVSARSRHFVNVDVIFLPSVCDSFCVSTFSLGQGSRSFLSRIV